MPRAIDRDAIYRRRRFNSEDIELCVRWYITYRLSYRDLVAMMADRGVRLTHTTIMRWVTRYVPVYIERWNRWSKPVGRSWRVDETSIAVRGQKHYLYRAVDKAGKTVASMLSDARTMQAAQEFFRGAVCASGSCWPEKINLDRYHASHKALQLLGEEDVRWQSVVVRGNRYLNNVVEQDHRAVKQRCAPMLGFKSGARAAVTLAGLSWRIALVAPAPAPRRGVGIVRSC
ncbi:MAG: IS6 family transposase [Steroidobacteraceae bacterium]